jgi:signal transduction histidine kinase
LVLIAALVAQWRRGRRDLDLQARQHAGADARTGVLVHELKQPLTAILSNAQAAQRFLASDRLNLQELREILDDIVTDDKRAAGIVRSIGGILQETKVSSVGKPKVSADGVSREVRRTVNVGTSKLPDSDHSGSRKERAQ